jgi:tetratricopeptide (TPR) repeat protein
MGRASEISRSFHDLRAVADSFATVPGRPGQRRRIASLATHLGATAVPFLSRKLGGGDDLQAEWAYYLLMRVGSQRALAAARDLAGDPRLSDERRALALALLGELGAPLPGSVRFLEDRPDDDGARPLAELTRGLAEAADVARAADELLARSEGRDLIAVCRALVAQAHAAAAPVLEELVARDDVSAVHKQVLAPLRASLGRAPIPPARPGRVLVGVGPAGLVVVAVRRGAGARRRRVLLVHLAPDGTLARVVHDDTGAPALAPAPLRQRLVAEGFTLRRARVGDVSARLALAARAVCLAGAHLPRAYHLGRDLVGLADEHAAPPPPHAPDALFERGRALLDEGDAVRARPLLGAYASVRPEDAEGRTWLGSCLLALAEVNDALAHLTAAVRLEPEDAVRRWNLAAAAKGAGRSGAAYLALVEYLRLARGKSSARRRRLARRFVRTYQRMIHDEHPGVAPRVAAAAEEPFLCACDHLEAGRAEEAARGFRGVLERVPSHHPSWSNLGAAHLLLGEHAEARRCLETALAYRPDYDTAEKNLRKLEPPRVTR